ncbi:hypothetical protein NIES932_23670 [Raphidiopsis curvata NIES-932]|nr:hypothetical protein NIES932_23670 [Raphidiopsis curvata NIES-932]
MGLVLKEDVKVFMMDPNTEIRRLLDIVPASGRMTIKIISKPEQNQVISAEFPLPWIQSKPVYINFELWRQLKKPQRDLLILYHTSWLIGIKWIQPDIYQGAVLVGLLGGVIETLQGDIVGLVIAGGLTITSGVKLWQNNKSQELQLKADKTAIAIAQNRGYSESEAAGHLLTAIETVAKLEGRLGLNFNELIRCQNLRAIAS